MAAPIKAARRPLLWLAAAGVITLAAAGLACGGGDDGGAGPISEQEAKDAADQYFQVSLGLFTGDTAPQDFIDLFAPECREDVDPGTIAFATLLIQAFAPELQNVDVEEVDVGRVTVEETPEGVLASVADPTAVRVRVDGEFVAFNELFASVGLDETEDSDIGEPVLLVRRDGEILLGDCSGLSDFSGDQNASGTPIIPGTSEVSTPEQGASATPQASGPGTSRSDPVPLGGSAVVDDKWEITVVQVVEDAWPLIEDESSFNEPPATDERLVLVTLLVENVSSEDMPANISGFEVRMTGSHNELYSLFDQEHDCGAIPDTLDADLFPGGQTEGNVCFRIPADETDLLLVWQPFVEDLTYFDLD